MPDAMTELKLIIAYRQLRMTRSRMMHNPPGYLNQLPTKRGHSMPRRRFDAGKSFEPKEKIVGDHANAEIHGIGVALTARHLILAEAVFELFIEVLRLPALIVPA